MAKMHKIRLHFPTPLESEVAYIQNRKGGAGLYDTSPLAWRSF